MVVLKVEAEFGLGFASVYVKGTRLEGEGNIRPVLFPISPVFISPSFVSSVYLIDNDQYPQIKEEAISWH